MRPRVLMGLVAGAGWLALTAVPRVAQDPCSEGSAWVWQGLRRA
jgi:hypothetical protein